MSRILVISRNTVGAQMSAPGIRALNVARTLARRVPGAQVTLAVPGSSRPAGAEAFSVAPYSARSLPRLVRDHDVIIAQYIRATAIPFLAGKRVVLDFFANFIAEWLELWAEWPDDPLRDANMEANRRYLNLQLSLADFVLAANERQRDLWLGTLAAIGRVTPAVYDADPSLRSLIDVAPFGVRPEPAVARKRVLKGVYPGIEADDFVLIWNGGVLHWYDPATLLQAMALVAKTHPKVKLFFLGTKYPISDPIEGKTLTDMLSLSQALGLTGRTVFFNEGWVDYDDSGDFLVEADAGVCAYFDNLETHFAHRVRLVDLIWAEAPIICNERDEVAEMVREKGLGISVPFRDVKAMAEAIIKIADDDDFRDACKANARALKPALSWENCLAPLVRYCSEAPAASPSRSPVASAVFAGSYVLSRLDQMARGLAAGKPAAERRREAAARQAQAAQPA
ncbi:MAG TPA: glycosyltransferase [Dehalococcoidia bacterium]|nr:glycosyltransferase [Dehalococcoidia bacterium]